MANRIRNWAKRKLQDILEIKPPSPMSHVGGIALGSIYRTPEEAALVNYNEKKPLARVVLHGDTWRCPAGHRNAANGTGHANCQQCCWPVHLNHPA